TNLDHRCLPRSFDDPVLPNAPGGDGSDIGAFEVQTACNQLPVAKCKNVTVSASTNCTANASIDDGSFDPDVGDTIILIQVPPGPYPIGTNTVTLIVTDSHGATNSCPATVAVVDTTPPTIHCPGNITTNPGPDHCSAVVSFVVTAL